MCSVSNNSEIWNLGMYSRWDSHDAIGALSPLSPCRPGRPRGGWAERCCPTRDVTIDLSHFNKHAQKKRAMGVNERWRARLGNSPELNGDRRFSVLAEVAETPSPGTHRW